jgi:rhamnosyl/mannosyltransferase
MTWLLKRSDIIVATSPNYLKTSTQLRFFESKVVVIPLGVKDSNKKIIGKSYVVSDSVAKSPFFLFVGEFRYYKGLFILLDAAAKVNANIVLVGAGKLERKLRQKVKALGLKNVVFTGPIDDKTKEDLYRQAKAVVFPSHMRSEAFGVTLIEGAMFGKPLISCEIGTGTSYVNLDGVTGITCKPSDPESLAKAMNLLMSDNELSSKMGVEARLRYQKKFQDTHMFDGYERVYQMVLNQDC